jgi:hypothetical protein
MVTICVRDRTVLSLWGQQCFLEYHADRFTDASLLIEEDGLIEGLLPANRVEDIVYSHQGFTFGGLITADTSTLAIMRRLDAIVSWLRQQGVAKMVYKALFGELDESIACPITHIMYTTLGHTNRMYLVLKFQQQHMFLIFTR